MGMEFYSLNCTDKDLESGGSGQGVVLLPHQGPSLAVDSPKIKAFSVPTSSVVCDCQRNGGEGSGAQLFGDILNEMHDGLGPSITWMDPVGIPVKCLARLLSDFANMTRTPHSSALGIRLHELCRLHVPGDSQPWEIIPWLASGSASAPLNPVWYADLGQPTSDLKSIASAISPLEFFPLVEFPAESIPERRANWSQHRVLLETHHVRTERFIHYSNRWPDRVFRQLTNSFEAHSRAVGVSRSVAVTPGAPGPAYIAILAAAAVSNAFLVMDPNCVPFPANNAIAGSIVLRVRE